MGFRVGLLALSLALPPVPLLSQDTLTVADTLPGRAINLGIGHFGLSLGNSARWNGIRINIRDRAVRDVNGLNLTLGNPGKNRFAVYRGVSLGLGPYGATLMGLNVGLAGLVAERGLYGVNLAGLGVVSNGDMVGINISGLGTVSEGDMAGLNDRVMRVVLHEFRRQIQARQHHIVSFQLCRRVWQAWLDRAFLAGALPIPADYATNPDPWAKVRWMPQGWPYLHPVQDVEAAKAAIRCGFTTRSAAVSEQGEDAEAIDAEQAADNARADALGLSYDSDGRKAGGKGAPAARADDDPQPQPAPAEEVPA